jgi:hypothetical protein
VKLDLLERKANQVPPVREVRSGTPVCEVRQL